MFSIRIVSGVMLASFLLVGCGKSAVSNDDGKKESNSVLSTKKEQVIRELNALLSDFPDNQRNYLIYDKGSSDDEANALANLMKKDKLSKYVALKKELFDIESKMK